MAIATIDRITSGRHVVAIERTAVDAETAALGRVYRWRCSCDRGCKWKASERNVRWGANRHIDLAEAG